MEFLPAFCARRCWFFDMDGTLTEPVHDYVAMRREMGMGPEVNLVETVWGLSEPQRSEKKRQLDAIGARFVAQARPQSGALELLQELRARGRQVGLITRNSRSNTIATLAALGLEDWFAPEVIATRDDSVPKPAPDAILALLQTWGCAPTDAVMVGDAAYDLDAGQAAGVATVLVDPTGDSPLRAAADASVCSPAELWSAVLRTEEPPPHQSAVATEAGHSAHRRTGTRR